MYCRNALFTVSTSLKFRRARALFKDKKGKKSKVQGQGYTPSKVKLNNEGPVIFAK